MKILTLEYKSKEKFEKMRKVIRERVLYTLVTEYKSEIISYIIAYTPTEEKMK